MTSRIILPEKRSSETLLVPFNFLSALTVGTTISSASVTATVYSGTDASPSAIISGSATISGAIITQKIVAGTAGVTYLLAAAATTSDGQVLVLNAYLVVF